MTAARIKKLRSKIRFRRAIRRWRFFLLLFALLLLGGAAYGGYWAYGKILNRQAHALVGRAVEELKNGKVTEARMGVETALRIKPGHPPATRLLARIQAASGEPEAALASFQKLTDERQIRLDELKLYAGLAAQKGETQLAGRIAKVVGVNGDPPFRISSKPPRSSSKKNPPRPKPSSEPPWPPIRVTSRAAHFWNFSSKPAARANPCRRPPSSSRIFPHATPPSARKPSPSASAPVTYRRRNSLRVPLRENGAEDAGVIRRGRGISCSRRGRFFWVFPDLFLSFQSFKPYNSFDAVAEVNLYGLAGGASVVRAVVETRSEFRYGGLKQRTLV